VSLAAVPASEGIPAAVVDALEIVVLAGESATQAVERFLAGKEMLLVLDNLEHLPAAAAYVGALLGACPALTILATSREPLSLQAEQRHPVSPLTLDADAVALFSDRARAHDPAFTLAAASASQVAEICRRVDGLPLAIELAAARCGLLSVAEIAERLDAAVGTPGAGAGDSPARQQTLRATIDWSHDLLGAAEQMCFARCAVFAGGATLEAAETVTGAGLETLEGLVAKSLLVRRRQERAPTRLSMLETVRVYAAERLDAATDAERVRVRHYDHFLATARRDGAERVLWGSGGRERLAGLSAEHDNLAAALAWAIGRSDAERALALAGALGAYWLMRGRFAEAAAWGEQALDLPEADDHPALRFSVLHTSFKCLWQMGRAAEQPAVLAALQAIAERLDDPVLRSRTLQLRVDREMDGERLDVADALAAEALHWARTAGDEWEVAEASHGKAIAASSLAELRERVATAATLLTDVGNVHQLANMLTGAAYAALCLGSERDAQDLATRAAHVARALDSRFVRMMNSGNLGLAALLSGETDAAWPAFREELALCRDMVVRPVVSEGLRGLAAIAVLDGDAERAATLVGAADAHRYDNAEDAVDVRLDATFFEPARARCGSDAWTAAARAGGALSFEEAIAYALEEPTPA
jgi:predicted ATPase